MIGPPDAPAPFASLPEGAVWTLREDLGWAPALRAALAEGGLAAAVRLPTTNRRTAVARVRLGGRALVAKRYGGDPASSLRRRAGLWLSGLSRDHARAAYAGARALEAAGVPTGRAVGWCSWPSGPLAREGIALFEEIEGAESLRALRSRYGARPGPAERARYTRLVVATVELVRRMHAQGLRHGSVELGNVLVGGEGPAGSAPERLHLVDTDRVRRVRLRPPLLARALDVRDLARLDLDREGRRLALARYLGRAPGPWWGVLCAWRLARFRPRAWWRRRGRPRWPRVEPRAADLEG